MKEVGAFISLMHRFLKLNSVELPTAAQAQALDKYTVFVTNSSPVSGANADCMYWITS